MLKKFVAPVVLGAALLGTVASGGIASAGTPTTTPVAAHATAHRAHHGHHALRSWWKANRRSVRAQGLAIGATVIGVTPQALAAELRTGKSVAQVAGEHGVAVSDVVNALTAAADAKVTAAVTAGKLTPTQGATITAKLPARITRLVNHVF